MLVSLYSVKPFLFHKCSLHSLLFIAVGLCSGERRIRVHTLCVAVSSQPAHVYAGLNVQAITGVLAMMGKLTRI